MLQIMEPNPILRDDFSKIADELDKTLTLASSSSPGRKREDVEEEEEEEFEFDHCDDSDDDGEFEFAFAAGELKSPVAAEEVFHNGKIRPINHHHSSAGDLAGKSDESSAEATTSYGPPVRKLFVVSSSPENDDVAEGPYCAWSKSPEMSRKSNSTGFSKLWRVKDLLVRSHSDGKDAFVFLTGKSEEEKVGTASFGGKNEKEKEKKKKKKVNVAKIEVGRGGGETASLKGDKKKKKKKEKSVYEELYGGKREKEKKLGGKSYLPYRQDLVGFFTNASGMSRNVHPY